jgi:TRAP-type mannitol/chloroaromatic compound transport system substrate-binding protein
MFALIIGPDTSTMHNQPARVTWRRSSKWTSPDLLASCARNSFLQGAKHVQPMNKGHFKVRILNLNHKQACSGGSPKPETVVI